MASDVFGNLMEWDRVLGRLDDFKRAKLLDEHQAGLARILRYRRNWQLMECVLTFATEIRQASDLLIAEVLNVLVAEDVPVRQRVLAAAALGHLVVDRPSQKDEASLDMDRVVQTLVEASRSSCPPVVRGAIRDAIDVLRRTGS